ncbi:MAG TPA: phosphopantetheine-binding protein, partial [Pyrinomonadaceae bacterium]|nr:phosphopantetheine-binding protein [Pyrinomonadaceae bacterium]
YVREVVEGRGYEVMREEEGLWSLIGMQRRGQQNVIVGLNPSNPLVKRQMKLNSPSSSKAVAYYTASKNILPSDALDRLSHAMPLNSQISFEFRRVEFMPYTDTGKIDKQRLHSLNSKAVMADEYHAPQREIEKQMADIWERILERKPIGLNDKFFEVGGNSLKSIRLLAAINEKFSSNVAIVDLFKFSTIKALSMHVEKPTDDNGNQQISGLEF